MFEEAVLDQILLLGLFMILEVEGEVSRVKPAGEVKRRPSQVKLLITNDNG
jgi:hypothetical protein